MKRKLIPQGKGALTVSLPKKWIDAQLLQAGEEIDVSERDSALIISAEGKLSLKETTIHLDYLSVEGYRSIIGGLYRGGYDIIHVRFDDTRVFQHLEKAINSIYGYEVFYGDITHCTIKSVYQTEQTTIQEHYRRMVFTIQTMHQVIAEDFTKGEWSHYDELIQLRNNILKQRDLIARMIQKKKLLDNSHFPYYAISFGLWNVARSYFHLYRDRIDIRPTEEGIRVLEHLRAYIGKSFSSIHRLTQESFLKRHADYVDMYERCRFLLREDSLGGYLMNIVINVQLCDSSIYVLNFG